MDIVIILVANSKTVVDDDRAAVFGEYGIFGGRRRHLGFIDHARDIERDCGEASQRAVAALILTSAGSRVAVMLVLVIDGIA